MDGLQPYVPAGFAEFWKETVELGEFAPLDYEVKDQPQVFGESHVVKLLEFRSIHAELLHGWIASPIDQDGEAPAFLWIPPYSRWSMLPNEYGTRPGYASLSINFFGESAFHQEEYTPERGYFAQGVASKDTWVFRDMFMNCVLAGKILSELSGVDSKRMAAMGMSQGGGIAIWLGAWWNSIKAVVADEPFLGGMPWVLSASSFRYPLKELTDFTFSDRASEAAVRETLSYYDTINQATCCHVPTRVTLGLKDPAVKPVQARAVYEALPGKKELEELDWGHDWHPRMAEGGRAWLEANL